jgi:2,3-bisphosphoglycerate-dependent phosphoglycerate mutase
VAREDTAISTSTVHLYLVRHCQSSGQAPDAPLTPRGHEQAARLAETLGDLGIARIVSSSFLRAQQSVEPLSRRLRLPVELDARLIERNLSPDPLENWRGALRAAWGDHDLALPGGESSRAATERGLAALRDILAAGRLPAAVVTHGNLLALLLHAFDGRPGYETWEALSNPDLFEVVQTSPETFAVTRIWTP